MNEQVAERTDLTDGVISTQHELSELQPTGSSPAQPNDTRPFRVAVAATYTADPLIPLLGFWFRTLALSAEVVLAPYAQVMQQLLDPYSELSRNKGGVNVLMVRLQDWIRDRTTHPIEENLKHLRSAADELTAAIDEFRGRTPGSLLVCFCPSSAELSHTYQQAIEGHESRIAASLRSGPNVQCLSHVDAIELFPEVAVEDARAERIGHVPYTEEYFIALATLLARRIAVSRKPPFKVIAVDADNTLWDGVCGEVNASGIGLTETHLELQRMLVRQHDAGMLICLCSKNNLADVQAVFREREDMVLREQHVICWRVNWESKSSNLRSLAEELSLSLDSFIFIDDSAIECAEVRANAPGVLALQLPDTPEGVAHLLKHAWAFDRHGVTDDARRRTEQYRQNQKRAEAMRSSGSLHQFLASLELQVDIGEPGEEDLARIAELTQRTNQFNLTTIRRSASEIAALREGGDLQMRVIHLKDRFGDYGLVGAVMFRRVESDLEVDTFVLSCRALGRGVELQIAADLGHCARDSGHSHVLFRFRRTARNAPAWTYLQSSFAQFELPRRSESQAAEHLFRVPAQYAQDLLANTSAGVLAPEAEQATQNVVSVASHEWHESALRLSRLEDIAQAIVQASPRSQRSQREHVAAESEMELALARIWADLLRLDQVGLRENFLELGGDSLLAVRVVARIGAELGLELPLHDFFANPTIEGIAAALGFASKAGPPIEPMDHTQPAPLSWSQRRLWFIDQLEGGSVAYHIPLVARLQGNLNTEALSAALQELMQRHEVLRTAVDMVAGEPVQSVAADAQLYLRDSSLEDLAPDLRQEALDRLIRAEISTPFDLTRGPLIRAALIRLAAGSHVLVIVMHHLVSDGWSIGVFMRELGALYEAHLMRRPCALPQLAIQYGDYARWQAQALAGAVIERQLEYWKAHLGGAPELLELPTDRPRPHRQSHKGGSRRFNLDAQLTRDLAALCRRCRLTLPMALHTAWSVVLSRLSGQDDIVLGVPVANRRRAEVEGLIGFFVNTLAIRLHLDEELSLDALLLRVKSALLQGYAHQDVPFERVVEVLQPARSAGHSAIFQGMFVFQNAPREPMQLAGLSIAEVESPNDTAKFDLTLTLQPSGEQLAGSLNYALDLFEPDTIDRWIGHFQLVLREMVRDPRQRLAELRMMEGAEQRRVAEVFNQTSQVLEHELIHRLFERQVDLVSHAPAVIFGDRSLSFGELNEKANQLAHYLRERGVGPDALVAVCFERGLEMMIAIFGVLKAGGAYVPLDPSNPPDRLAHVLNDARPKVLLTVSALVGGLSQSAAEVVALDSAWNAISLYSPRNPDPTALGLTPRHLAYVIYTSGSTGKPKGVMIEHRNIANYSLHALRQFDVASGGGSLLATSLGFDLALTGLYPTLLAGRPVRICREEHGMPALVEEVHRCSNLSPLKLTPSHLKLLEESLLDGDLEGRVQTLVLGGEPLPSSVVSLWKEHSPKTRVFNHYGPTETTVGCAVNEIVDPGSGVVPIGRPISNTQIYILDRHRRVVPIGVVGELYIGGAGVARGYLNRPELTAERFISDPFNSDPAARLYKTGDLGRWRADGVIEFLGRNDHQVKIRGFRIELGEIEAQLSKLGDVHEAAVLAREDASGEKRLVAYIVWQSEAEMSVEALRTHLKASLPEYMVPSAFVRLQRMPLTSNGKLDRRALPAPELGAYASREYQPPQGEIEEIVAGIWQTLLGVQQVGRLDNFFELGGHSLLIVQMMERLRRAGLSTEVRQVFDSATLSDLAQALRSDAGEQWAVPPNKIPEGCEAITPQMLPLVELEAEHIERIAQSVPGGMSNIQDIYPLAPLQEGILFHHLLSEGGGDPYVVPTLLSVSDRARVNELVAALQRVMDRHDVLRTSILWEQLPRAVQVVHRRAQLAVEEVTLDGGLDVSEQLKAWLEPARQRLNLQRAPLMRLQIAADPHSPQWFVMLQFHHVIGDNVSQDIITSEVAAFLQGRAVTSRSVPYRNHVAMALAQARANDSEAFFREKLADVDEPTAAFGLVDVLGDGQQLVECHDTVPLTIANRVRALARRLNVSVATLFHAAWALVVAHTSGRDDVVFGSVLLGRLHGQAEVGQALGMFINTLPLRLKLGELSARALIEHTQRELVALLGHEQAALATAQRCSGISGSAPLFNALLNYRHGATHVQVGWAEVEGVRVMASHSRTNYPITLSVGDLKEQGFELVAQTDAHVDASRITSYVRTALEGLLHATEQEDVGEAINLGILPEAELHELTRSLNSTAVPFPMHTPVHELFEEQARRMPDALAALEGERMLTYGQLNARANQLARFIRAHGVEPGECVAVLMSRSMQMLAAQIAVLKSGCVYVPLDPEMPHERRAFMLEDCGARTVLVDDLPKEEGVPLQWLDCRLLATRIEEQSTENLHVRVEPVPAAYLMYTSGSTGVPKGVLVPHHGINRLVINNGYANFATDDCFVHYSNPAFDASTLEIWGPLLSGARVLIVPQRVVLEAEQFAAMLLRHRVTVLYMSVGLFNQYTQALAGVFERLRLLMVGGDSLDPAAVRRVLRASPPGRLLNVYGPTESTTFATTYHIEEVPEGARSIPIGRPISNTQIYILDRHRRVVPIGVVGELYIGGAGVARGYLNRPELTAERFISDPFNSDPAARLYKTGDLGRWRADGVIEFLGRNDHQVKIRGFRIELGEIEAQLSKLDDVHEAAVLAREDASGEKRLVAYIVWQSEAEMSVEALRTHLKASLPEYMVPSAFVRLQRMPLTSNGKLDRRALPAPELDAYASREYQPPQGEIEEIVAGIWQTLLGVQQVGRLDNFFELGGHSLLIVQMMERLRRAGLSTEVRQVFDSATLSDLAQALRSDAGEQWAVPPNQIPEGCEAITPQMLPLVELEAEHIERIAQSVPGGMSNIQDIYPLAPLQEGILFHHLLSEGGGDPYVVPTLLSVSDRARVNELVAALQRVMDRHDVLRTSILWEQLPRAVQVVHRRAQLAVEEVTLDGGLDVSEQLKAWLEPARQRLNLQRAPLMRLQIAADPHSPQWFVMFQLHHIIDDATSRRLLIEEVVACMEDRADQLPVAVSYREHVARTCARAELHDATLFFQRKLGDVTEPTAPFGILDVHGTGAATKEACEHLDLELARRLRAQARRLGVSAATLFHAAWALVVAHTSGRDDVVFGSVLLGRMQGSAETQRTLGMFINTLPLRVQLQNIGVKALIEQTQRELVELFEYEQASLAMAQSCSGVTSGAALFSALLNYRHSTGNLTVNWANARGVQVIGRRAGTNYPVTLSVDDLGEGFRITVQTDQAIDPARVTSYVEGALSGICEALETSPQCRALAVPVLGENERQQLLESFNANAMPYPREALIHELFEEQARRTPELPAVLHHDQSLTYQDLNRKANQLARHLRSLGVSRNEVVGICIERSLDMVVGLLGILKAGAGYLPLDPSHPTERLEHMLSDALPRVVLTQDALRERVPDTQANVVAIDTVLAQLPGSGYDNLERAPEQTSADLLYVIYTSGSTGRPKGTAMPHASMTNLMQWHAATLPALGQRVLQFAALSFDVAFQEIFSTLCTGGTLVMLDESIRRDARALMELLNASAVQRLFLPPLMLQSLAESSTTKMPALFLKDIITAGEQLRVSQEIVQFIQELPGCRLHNHYGPTETHVVTALTLEGDPCAWPKLPSIGRPISNTRIYVLNSEARPTPLGVAGEIYIGGANVARGYMNRAELTAERFTDDPFSANPGARMYRTGDLGRWRSDGTVEYLGRNDDQVKIRGFRIELGEVEGHLAACAGVREAAVIAREDTPGDRRLVAYLTVRERTQHSAEHLRAALKNVLPDYMIPSAFVTLDELPLTPTGKLNRRALPMPDAAAFDTGNYEAPRGEVERGLADLWQQLLRVERVGRFDHFFELGGHSLHGMKVALNVEQRFGVHLSVVAVFQYPTVEELAQVIERSRATAKAAATADDDDAGDFEEGVLFVGIAEEAAPGDVVNGG